MSEISKYRATSYTQQWVLLIAASIFVHFMGFAGIGHAPIREKSKFVVVKMTYQPKALMGTVTPPKKKLQQDKLTNHSSSKKVLNPIPQKITQGINRDQMVPAGTISVPVGNSLAVEDEGIRRQNVESVQSDLSSVAKLIPETLTTPAYTDDAIDAGVEGVFIVDVFVNADGTVRNAELRKKIGFGMDSRVLSAISQAKFYPRKNKFGVSEEGWTELKFKLVIP